MNKPRKKIEKKEPFYLGGKRHQGHVGIDFRMRKIKKIEKIKKLKEWELRTPSTYLIVRMFDKINEIINFLNTHEK